MRILLRTAALLGLMAYGSTTTTAQSPADPAGVTNFRQVPSTVACAGATRPEAMRAVKDLGYASVVNLRMASEADANVEAESEAAAAAGIKYIHLPFDGAKPDPAVVDRFLETARDAANQPMFIHCASGNRAAAMWMIKRVAVDGWTLERAGDEAATLGLRSAPLKQFATEYLASRKK